jgi:hypothetical protein
MFLVLLIERKGGAEWKMPVCMYDTPSDQDQGGLDVDAWHS